MNGISQKRLSQDPAVTDVADEADLYVLMSQDVKTAHTSGARLGHVFDDAGSSQTSVVEEDIVWTNDELGHGVVVGKR